MSSEKPLIQIFVCGAPGGDLEAAWHQSMAEIYETEWRDNERDQDLGDVENFQHEQIEFCDLREDVDPYWPPTGTTSWYEEAERDLALVYE